MSYEECDAHGTEATNGCEECRRERIAACRERAERRVYEAILEAVNTPPKGPPVVATIPNVAAVAAIAAVKVLEEAGLLDLDKEV
jgi:hypothetical protein